MRAIREHWGIENSLHWTLDVAFNEDNSMKRAGNAAENFSVITKIVLNAVKQSQLKKGVTKLSVKAKRKKAGWSNGYLTAILINAQQVLMRLPCCYNTMLPKIQSTNF